MKSFLKFDFDIKQCGLELAELKILLDSKSDLSERLDILPFFDKRRHLSAFIASYSPYMGRFDRLAFEYQLYGDFSCDLVVGDSRKGYYCFIEFENANDRSVFEKKQSRNAPEWGARFDHGFSQLVDWFWKLEDMKQTQDSRNRFEAEELQYFGLLVIGRNKNFERREIIRKQWRVDRVVIDSKKILCVTFDELYSDLYEKFLTYEAIANNLRK
jgi:Domain of unknown function (DUF4263)